MKVTITGLLSAAVLAALLGGAANAADAAPGAQITAVQFAAARDPSHPVAVPPRRPTSDEAECDWGC
jgi:hypothetical protein